MREAVVYHSIDGRFGIQQGRWKLELCPGSGGWGNPGDSAAKLQGLPPVQLYDKSADIGETQNVQVQHPEIVRKLTRLLKKYVDDGRSTPGLGQTNDVSVDIWKYKMNEPKNNKPAEDRKHEPN